MKHATSPEPVARPEVRVFSNLEDLSRQAASRFEELANQRIAEGNIFAAALSGGSTPGRLYQLLAGLLSPQASGWPRLGLVLLGMGPDGHTASLFPGSAALDEQSRWVTPNYVEKLKAYRLTLTFPVLNAAGEVIFLVAGADKAEALRQVLDASSAAEKFPAQRVRPAEGQVRWYVDEAAARLL